MPCWVKNHQYMETCGESNNRKSKRACIADYEKAFFKELHPKGHEDRIAEKGFNSFSHCSIVRKFIPVHQEMKIPDAKAAVDKEWEKLDNLPAWQMAKSKEPKGGPRGTERAKNSPSCCAAGHLSSQECGVGTIFSAVQRPGCTPR